MSQGQVGYRSSDKEYKKLHPETLCYYQMRISYLGASEALTGVNNQCPAAITYVNILKEEYMDYNRAPQR